MEEECEIFRDTIEELSLAENTLGEGRFTWNNKRKWGKHIDSRLDRFLVSETIMDSGSEIHSMILLEEGLDH